MWNPLGNPAANLTAEWHPEPPHRGTFSILSTSLITIILCTWTALHLNIPEHGKTDSQIWRKIKWLIIGLLAPEIVAFVAFMQWQTAKELHKQSSHFRQRRAEHQQNIVIRHLKLIYGAIITMFHEPQGDPEANQIRYRPGIPWTMTHSHYAVMGGFAFDISSVRPSLRKLRLPEGKERVALMPAGILALAQIDRTLFPNIQETQIDDKSKADFFGKVLVCIQALWYCLQVITRLAQHLPITLLEITTIAHALTAFFVFFMWWNKPLEITEPTLISIKDEDSARICAVMCMRSPDMCHVQIRSRMEAYGIVNIVKDPRDSLKPKTKQNNQKGKGISNIPEAEGKPPNETPAVEEQIHDAGRQDGTNDPEIPFSLTLGEQKNGLVFKEAWSRRKLFLPDKELKDRSLEVEIDKSTWLRYKLATAAFQESRMKEDGKLSWSESPEPFVTFRAKNFPIDYLRQAPQASTILIGMMLINIAYGGVHLLAWNGPFPSQIQLVLWKLSALTISAPGVIVLVLGVLGAAIIALVVFIWLAAEALGGILGVIAMFLLLIIFGVPFLIIAILIGFVKLCRSGLRRLFSHSRNTDGIADSGKIVQHQKIRGNTDDDTDKKEKANEISRQNSIDGANPTSDIEIGNSGGEAARENSAKLEGKEEKEEKDIAGTSNASETRAGDTEEVTRKEDTDINDSPHASQTEPASCEKTNEQSGNSKGDALRQKLFQLQENLKKPIQSVTWWAGIAALILYFLSRTYVLVECFIDLAYAPDGVFQLPVWSRYLPHIS